MRLSGHSKLGAAALLKAVWWHFRLAGGLVVSLYGYGFLSGGKR